MPNKLHERISNITNKDISCENLTSTETSKSEAVLKCVYHCFMTQSDLTLLDLAELLRHNRLFKYNFDLKNR